ncbi:MAG: XrtN system VIT domain-containing protein, partial [Bacteroidota bacterium]
GFSFLMIAGFLFKWNQVQNKVETAIEIYEEEKGIGLPMWAVVSQHLPDDPLAEYVILGNFFTQKSYWEGEMNRFNRIGEFGLRHDPLALIATTFLGKLDLSSETAKEILASRYGARHQTHRRLWRGDKLETTRVQTELEIHADYRLAYVEKTLDIHYARKGQKRWREEQEAVYSFHLPEGTVATSLSLWINGKEEKSRLTTKSKADSAYVSIVGVERRDPALMHWQEGNRVTVTVFPCTPKEDRRFKIGFTMPITYEEGILKIENIYFDGPPTVGTEEKLSIRFVGSEPQELDLPYGFQTINEKEYKLEANYAPNWNISWKAPKLGEGSFAFHGKKYQIAALQKELIPWEPEDIILDINSSWKAFELSAIWDLVKDKKVYVFNPEQTVLTEENHEDILLQMSGLHFSLLPLNKLPDPTKTLIISAGTSYGPLLADLPQSAYAREMSKFLLWQNTNYRWYNLRSEVSPYVETLNAFHRLDFVRGNIKELETLLVRHKFPIIQRDENHIALHSSQIQLKQEFVADSLQPQNTAPDHLMRLFRYNELLQDIGRQFFDRKALEESWIKKAEEAYVLSPVSSLIVLETLEDYERFGIEENENTLGNAKMGNSGAVPEPHEWLLILMVISLILWKSRGRFF